MLADPGYGGSNGPLSPSQWLTFNTAASDDLLPGLNDDGNSIDMLRMYFDLQAQQEKPSTTTSSLASPSIASPSSIFSFLNPPSPLIQQQQQQQQQHQQQQPVTVSMADIEQWHSLLANSGMASLSPATANAPLLSRSAFSPSMISGGSEVPVVDPAALFGSIFGQTPASYMQQQQQQQQQSPPLHLAPQTIKVEQNDDAEYAPIMPVASTSKVVSTAPHKAAEPRKRGVSALIIPNSIPEEPESSESESDPEDVDSEDVQTKNKRKRGGNSASSKSRKTSSSTKKPNKASAPAADASIHPHALVPVPEYSDKPSKAEYEKLSSKEKRQLRNKISARNFRHRRKAHIDTLEAEINEKDSQIGVLSEEVGTLRSENQGLRADIELLKKNWESIAAKISAAAALPTAPLQQSAATSASASTFLSPDEDDLYGASGSLPSLSPPSSTASTNGEDIDSVFDTASSSAASTTATSAHLPVSTTTKRTTRNSTASASTAPRPNTRKDLSGSGNTFWGASSSGAPWMGGRTMDVHTTFIPEHNLLQDNLDPAALLGDKPASRKMDSLGAYFANLQSHNSFAYGQNMNPALNSLTPEQVGRLRDSQTQQKRDADPVRDGFFETNPLLSLRNDKLQDYRGQLYSKLAHNFAGIQAAQSASRAGNTLPEGLRPAFFAAPNAAVDREAELVKKEAQAHTATLQTAGALVTKTLFEKLSGAFWDAFAGEDPKTLQKGILPSKKSQTLDANKVADVIGGKSRLAVVPVFTSEKDIDSLSEKMAHVALDQQNVALRLPKRHNSL